MVAITVSDIPSLATTTRPRGRAQRRPRRQRSSEPATHAAAAALKPARASHQRTQGHANDQAVPVSVRSATGRPVRRKGSEAPPGELELAWREPPNEQNVATSIVSSPASAGTKQSSVAAPKEELLVGELESQHPSGGVRLVTIALPVSDGATRPSRRSLFVDWVCQRGALETS